MAPATFHLNAQLEIKSSLVFLSLIRLVNIVVEIFLSNIGFILTHAL